jgi:hypothetical protein
MDSKVVVNEIERAARLLRGYAAAGRVCGVSGKAYSKWAKAGRLPRTEATGETTYAQKLADADPRISKNKLLATAMKGSGQEALSA